jgi:hypothetical protein
VRREPLHDRYVILFFSVEGKLKRMFSNVRDIHLSSHERRRPGSN